MEDDEYGYVRETTEREPFDNVDSTLDGLEEIYLQHYDIQRDVEAKKRKSIEYVVREDDTLQGVSMRFSIHPQKMLEMNCVSDIVAGLVSASYVTQETAHTGKRIHD